MDVNNSNFAISLKVVQMLMNLTPNAYGIEKAVLMISVNLTAISFFVK